LFVVHNKYAFKKVSGGKVLLARVVLFMNNNGQIEPEFRLVGQPSASGNLRVDNYTIFTSVREALKAIKS
jgi:hypothetical protein